MMNYVIPMILLAAPIAHAQTQYKTTLDFNAVHQFGTSIDSGGKAEVTRAGFELRVDTAMTDIDDLQFRFQYQRDDWDFSGAGFGATNPWGTIDTIDASFQWLHQYNETTKWFASGLVRSSYEDSYSDGVVLGGALGLIHSYSSNVTLGLGLGVIEQQKDDELLFPVFVLEWNISETLRLTSDISSRFGSRTGVELVWSPQNDWSFGLGVAYDYNRFRLDNTGVAPGGAGEATSIPLSLRATRHVSPTFDLTLYGGIAFGGKLEVINAASKTISSTDYDAAGMIGVLGQVRF